MIFDLEDPRFWTASAFVVVVVLAYKKMSTLLTGALDSRAAAIKSELDEAHRLRTEAESVLAQYTQKQAEYLKEAEAILNDARRDAETIIRHAQQELSATLDTRMKNALERIAQEEIKAIADVRNHIVDMSLAAARSLIAEQVKGLSEEDMIQLEALTDVERKLH